MVDNPDQPIEAGCVICGPDVPFAVHQIDEGMYRSGETFAYHECRSCGSLQIAEVPHDLGRYYESDSYYSFQDHDRLLHNPWLRAAPVRALMRVNTQVFARTGIGRGPDWVRRVGPHLDDRILDLGCGSGEGLLRLAICGFSRLTGADPFLDADVDLVPGVPLLKRHHYELCGTYDWITMHHSFEHVPDPASTLLSARRLLSRHGRVLIRMPIMGKFAWRHYGLHWVQIDPPRHLVLFTLEAMFEMAKRTGFHIERVFYDSTAFQFWGSELVASGIPHIEGPSRFSRQRMTQWTRQANRLNRSGDGDQVGIVLRPASPL